MATPVKSTIGDRRSAFDAASEAVEGSPVFNYISNLSPIEPVKSVILPHSLQELHYGSPSVFASPKINSINRATGLRRDHFASSSEVKFSSDVEESKPSIPSNIECPHSTEVAAKMKCEKEDNDSSSVLFSADGESMCDDHNSNGDAHFRFKQSNPLMESYQILRCVDNGPMCSVTPSYNIKTEPGVAIPCILPSPDFQMTGVPSTFEQILNLFNNCGVESERQLVPDVQTCTDNGRKSIVSIHGQKDDVDPGYDLPDVAADALDEFFIFSPTAQTDAQLQKLGHTSNQSADFASCLLPKHSQLAANGWTSTQACDSLHSSYIACEQEHGNGLKEAYGQEDADLTPQMPSATMQEIVSKGDNIEKTDDRMVCPDAHWIPLSCKISNQQLRGVRRRCLVFEATEGQKNNVEDDPLFNSSNTAYAERLSPDDNQLFSCDLKRNSNKTLSGIGLHLNSLASPSLNGRVAKIEAIISGNQIEKKQISLSAGNSAYVNQKVVENSVDLESAARGSDISGDKTSYVHESFSGAKLADDMIEQSPKRKRRKETQTGENEGCKRCHCKKSKCLKLYCECFAAGVYCVNVCSCQGCLNKPEHEDIVIEIRERIENRNPFAFAPKIMKPPEPVLENMEAGTRVSVLPRHKTGCNCKKSKCTKKYCECFQGGVACSGGCRCEGCTNAFGKKEGVYGDLLRENSGSCPDQNTEDLSKTSREIENKDLETTEAAGPGPHLEMHGIQKDAQQSSRCPAMPAFEICSSAILPPPSSSGKLPARSRTSGCRAKAKKTNTTGFLFSRFQPEKHFMPTVVEDGIPEFLRVAEFPNNRVTVASPKRKRVSPPHIDAGAKKSLDLGSHRRLLFHPISSLQQVGIAPNQDDFQANCS